jgi:hypothetical protein
MRVTTRVDQLRVYSNTIAGTLDTSFDYVGDAKFISNLAQVGFNAAVVLHHR